MIKSLRWELLGLFLLDVALWFDPTQIYRVFELNIPTNDRLFLPVHGFATVSFISYLFSILFFTALFGYACLGRFWRNSGFGGGAVFASFWAGYIATVGLFRVFSLYLRPETAMYTTCGTMLCFMAYFYNREYACRLVGLPRPDQIKNILFITLGALLLFLLCIVLQVYMGDYIWVGHGPNQYLFIVKEYLAAGYDGTIPVIPQHLDEILFTTFVLAPVGFQFDPILVATVVLACNKVATGFFIYYALRTLKANWLIAAAGAVFLLFAEFGINPFKYLMYFDSNNPAAYIVHSGRIVGIPLAIYFATISLQSVRSPLISWSPVALSLLGFGIATTSISNFISTTAILLIGLFVRTSTHITDESEKQKSFIAITLIFIGSALAYHNENNLIFPAAGFLLTLLSVLYFLFPYARIFWTNRAQLILLPELKALAIWIVSGMVCLIFFANIFSANPLNVAILQILREWTGIDSLSVVNPFPSSFNESTGHLFGDVRARGGFAQYAIDSVHFIYQYGLMPLLLLITLMWPRRIRTRESASIFLFASLCFSLICLLFFYVDFVNDASRAWIKTRFIEQSLYLFFFLFFVALAAIKGRVIAGFYVALAFTWSVIPVLATERPQQWLENSRYLIKLLFGGLGGYGVSSAEMARYTIYLFNSLFIALAGITILSYWVWNKQQTADDNLGHTSGNKFWLWQGKTKYKKYIGVILIILICVEIVLTSFYTSKVCDKEDVGTAKISKWVTLISSQEKYCYAGGFEFISDVRFSELCQYKKGLPLSLLQLSIQSLDLVDMSNGKIISTLPLTSGDIDTRNLSDVEKQLIGVWKANDGKFKLITISGGEIVAINDDGNKDQLIVDGSSIRAKSWNVHPSLSGDGMVLSWGNGTVWRSTKPQKARILTELEKKLIGQWKTNDGEAASIFVAHNEIIAVNEKGNEVQLKVEGASIDAKGWKLRPSLSDDGKVLNWGNGTAWTR